MIMRIIFKCRLLNKLKCNLYNKILGKYIPYSKNKKIRISGLTFKFTK